LVGVDIDEGEIKLGERIVDVTMADLDDGLVLMGVPDDLSKEQKVKLRDVVAKASRRVLIVEGNVGERWKTFRLVPKETYDEDFDEASP
jgi:hypothetical protein